MPTITDLLLLPPRLCKNEHYAYLGQVSLNKRSYKLTTLTVEKFGRLGKGGNKFVDQLTTTVIGGADNGNLTQEGRGKKMASIISVITKQVAISRRVERDRLALGARREARENTSTPLSLPGDRAADGGSCAT